MATITETPGRGPRRPGHLRLAGIGALIALGGTLGLTGCSSDDSDPGTGTGDFETSQEELATMIAAVHDGGDPLYCESDATEVDIEPQGDTEADSDDTSDVVAGWLRGQDDYMLQAGGRLGMAHEPDAVTIWDTGQGFGLELLTEELSMMELDLGPMSSEVVFENMVTSGAGELRCRNLDRQDYPAPAVDRIYTMADVASGEMTPDMTESLFQSFNEF